MTTITHVWIVNRTEEYDPIYAFVDEEQAREYGARFPDAVVTEEVLMDRAAGAAFLVDTYEPDDEEPDDHSRKEEGRS